MIVQQIEQDFISAYKQKDEVRVRVLRLVKTAIKNLQVDLKRVPSEEEVLSLLHKQLKQRKDSIEQFILANREDLAKKEEEELEILKAYLPKPITGHELLLLVKQTIENLQVTSKKEFGKVIGAITKEYKGRVDGKEVHTVVQDLLQELDS